jgi:hypothetical protein
MTCKNKKVREILPEYMASRLSPERTQMIREHLGMCDECRQDLIIMESLAEETVPEPPMGFWNSLPGRVTSSIKDLDQKPHRFTIPAWAGGFAVAVLLILLIIIPWKKIGTDIRIPGEYYAQMTDRFGLGLEEEILSISGFDVAALDRSLEEDILLSGDLLVDDSPGGIYQPDIFDGMNDLTLEAFEKLIDEMSPMS